MSVVGERLRDSRHAQHLSLTDVAGKAGISAATLSRIENSKQGLDLGLFLVLAKILRAVPHELLAETVERAGADPLAKRIAALASPDRARMWRELAAARRTQRKERRSRSSEVSQQIEELTAQFEYVREELDSVRAVLNHKRR